MSHVEPLESNTGRRHGQSRGALASGGNRKTRQKRGAQRALTPFLTFYFFDGDIDLSTFKYMYLKKQPNFKMH